MVCTFFGHRDCPDGIMTALENVLIELIEKNSVNTFYVGNQGKFDHAVHAVLKKLQPRYPHIRWWIVLAYMPAQHSTSNTSFPSNTLLPEEVETVPKRFAISHRNRWMVDRADFVVCFVTRHYGGAATFVSKAERKGKRIINLAES